MTDFNEKASDDNRSQTVLIVAIVNDPITDKIFFRPRIDVEPTRSLLHRDLQLLNQDLHPVKQTSPSRAVDLACLVAPIVMQYWITSV